MHENTIQLALIRLVDTDGQQEKKKWTKNVAQEFQ